MIPTILMVLAALFVATVVTYNTHVGPVISEWLYLHFARCIFFGCPAINWLGWERPAAAAARRDFAINFGQTLLVLSPVWWFEYPPWRLLISFAWLVAAVDVTYGAVDPKSPQANFYVGLLMLIGATMMVFPIMGRASYTAAVAIAWFWYTVAVSIILWPVVGRPCMGALRQLNAVKKDARAAISPRNE